MSHLLQSGKLWLKTLCFGSLIIALMIMGSYAALYQTFSNERIAEAAEQATHSSSFQLQYSNIQRSLFPRPTLTLHNVRLIQRNSHAIIANIQTLRLGFAWSNLWSKQIHIEKTVINHGQLNLQQLSDGQWNIQGLLKTQPNAPKFNRLIIDNSEVNLNLPEQSYHISELHTELGEAQAQSRSFQTQFTLESPYNNTPIHLSSNGVAQIQANTWQFPQFQISAHTQVQQHNLALSIDGDAQWQQAQHTISLQSINLRADSPYNNLHITATVPDATWHSDGRFNLSSLNSVLTAHNNNSQLDSSLVLNKLTLRPTLALLNEFDLQASYKTNTHQTTINASGPLTWQKSQGISSNNLKITTHQDNLKAAPQPRFISQLQGNFQMSDRQHWQAQLTGQFDHQSANINANYSQAPNSPAKLSGSIELQKLALSPYWQDIQAGNGSYPKILQQSNTPEIEAQIQINNLTSPAFQINNLTTHLFANQARIAFTRMNANLYNGKMEGGISIANTNPLSYHLQQNATNVQILPLLQDLLGYHNLSGSGNAMFDLTTKGNDHQSMMKNLQGSMQLNVSDGALNGIDMNNALRRINNNPPPSSEKLQTPFRRFTMSSHIENGVSSHDNTDLTSDSILVSSKGQINLIEQTVNEHLLIRNAHNTQARPVPLQISGPLDNPSVTIDFQRLTYGLTTPEEKRQVLMDTLKDQWQWLSQPKK